MKTRNQWSILAAVVVAVGGIFLGLSAVREFRTQQMTHAAGNARGIYMLMYAAEMDAITEGRPSVWPSEHWTSSTDYFNAGSSNIFKDVQPSFFSAAGIPSALAWPMASDNNAWSVNASLTNTAEVGWDRPLLFTRNLHFRVDSTGAVQAYLTDEAPFGKVGAVIVTAGGASKKLMNADIQLAVGSADPQDVAHILAP